MKRALSKALSAFGLQLLRKDSYRSLAALHEQERRLRFLVWALHQGGNLDQLTNSRSQLQQDLFVLIALSFRTDGYFVEIGATNGESLSNTWLLEKEFSWTGILAEPAKVWHPDLRDNRNALIDTRLVWSVTGETVRFWESDSASLSTAECFSESDHHAPQRRKGRGYDVQTVSLTDLLETHKAPRRIDYLSIDSEGSELIILHSLDFQAYEFSVISVEHNFREDREKILSLLEGHGYQRVVPELSGWDDWFLHPDLPFRPEGLLSQPQAAALGRDLLELRHSI